MKMLTESQKSSNSNNIFFSLSKILRYFLRKTTSTRREHCYSSKGDDITCSLQRQNCNWYKIITHKATIVFQISQIFDCFLIRFQSLNYVWFILHHPRPRPLLPLLRSSLQIGKPPSASFVHKHDLKCIAKAFFNTDCMAMGVVGHYRFIEF